MKRPLLFIDNDKGGLVQVANVKGGVGKSTVATNVAAGFAKRGPTLLVDLDVQGSATVALGVDPLSLENSSYDLFRRKYLPDEPRAEGLWGKTGKIVQLSTHRLLAPEICTGRPVPSLTRKILPGFDLIGANSDLYRSQDGKKLGNLLFNLRMAREYYKYVVLDTPAVWNNLIQALYRESDLTLIPVTLNALSTKSLRDYIRHLDKLGEKEKQVKFRIVKNEVYGKPSSKAVGKAKTMQANREFLRTVVDTVGTKGNGLFVPESLVIDLEIPESSLIRTSQDQGKTIFDQTRSGPIQSAFQSLVRQVQRILNNQNNEPGKILSGHPAWSKTAMRLLKVACLALIVFWWVPTTPDDKPQSMQLAKMEQTEEGPIRFRTGEEALYKAAKYAICHYRAMVPSLHDVEKYVQEVIAIHNHNALPGEKIKNPHNLPMGVELVMYPPTRIYNPDQSNDAEVFKAFMAMVEDPRPYLTGLWADRGSGGGTPHAGVDVAAELGTRILSPVEGIAVRKYTRDGGRIVGVQFENSILIFCHLDRYLVSEGERVRVGQPIGTIGMTGRTSGPHVHIGYGIEYPSGASFGRKRYRMTDPKLWYFRHRYFQEKQLGL